MRNGKPGATHPTAAAPRATTSHGAPAGLPLFLRAAGIGANLDAGPQGHSLEQAAVRAATRAAGTAGEVSGEAPKETAVARSERCTPEVVARVLRSPGTPLDEATRARFEPQFGMDLSRVSVHADLGASESARALGAHAYTSGNHIVFGPGKFAPQEAQGTRLLAHELAHVAQQASGEAPANTVQRDEASPLMDPDDLIDRNRIFMVHDEFEPIANGLYVNFVVRGEDVDYLLAFFEEISSDWEDNVAAAFTELLNDSQLDKMASSERGRHTLTVLYDAMVTGSVSDFERGQSERVLHAKMRQINPEDYLRQQGTRPGGGRTQIFPVRNMRVTPGYDDAPLMAELRGDQVWAKYPVRVSYTAMFANESRTLKGDTFLQGQLLNPNEIVGIRNYEDDEQTEPEYVPALALIDYANQVKHSTLGKVVEVSIAAATLGYGGPAVAGEEGALAEGGAAVPTGLAKWLPRVDRFAAGLSVFAFFVDENRQLIEKLGPAGRWLVRNTARVNKLVAIYGIARLGQAGFRMAKSLRTSAKSVRTEAASLELTAGERVTLSKLDEQTEALAAELEKGAAARKAEIDLSRPPANDNIPESLPSEPAHQAVPRTGTDDFVPARGLDVRASGDTGAGGQAAGEPVMGPRKTGTPPTQGPPRGPTGNEPGGDLEPYEGSQKAPRKTPLRRPSNNTASEAARVKFDKVRDDYAQALGLPKGGQVHHAIELQTLDRFPGAYTEAELNSVANMRGVPPELEGKMQLHQSKIREVWNRHYREIEADIAQKGLKPGSAEYRATVRWHLAQDREEIDHVLGQFFSEEGAGRVVHGLPPG